MGKTQVGSIDWAQIVPGANSTVLYDFTDAELVPQETIDAFEGNMRALGKAVRSRTGGRFASRTITNEEGVKEVYALCIEHNPQLASKPKRRRRK